MNVKSELGDSRCNSSYAESLSVNAGANDRKAKSGWADRGASYFSLHRGSALILDGRTLCLSTKHGRVALALPALVCMAYTFHRADTYYLRSGDAFPPSVPKWGIALARVAYSCEPDGLAHNWRLIPFAWHLLRDRGAPIVT